jgi:thioredoxin reductase (NADPH)
LPQPGGQLAELYPKNQFLIFLVIPEVLAGDLVDNLMEQIKQFEPGFTLEKLPKLLKIRRRNFYCNYK